jgi:hypothetical protein
MRLATSGLSCLIFMSLSVGIVRGEEAQTRNADEAAARKQIAEWIVLARKESPGKAASTHSSMQWSIANAYAYLGDVEAFRLAQKEAGHTSSSDLCRLADSLYNAGDRAGALKFLAEAAELAGSEGRGEEDPTWADGSVASVACAYAAVGDFQQAVKLARELRYFISRARCLSDIGVLQAKKDKAGAEKTFAAARAELKGSKGEEVERVLSTIIRESGEAGELETVIKEASELKDPLVRASLLASVWSKAQKEGNEKVADAARAAVKAAMEGFKPLERGDVQSRLSQWHSVMVIRIQMKDDAGVKAAVDEQRKLIDTMDAMTRARELMDLMLWRRDLGAETAAALVREATEVVKGMPDAKERAHAHWMLVGRTVFVDDLEVTQQLLKLAMAEGPVEGYSAEQAVGSAAGLLARKIGERGDFTWIRELPTAALRSLAYAEAAEGLAERVADFRKQLKKD